MVSLIELESLLLITCTSEGQAGKWEPMSCRVTRETDSTPHCGSENRTLTVNPPEMPKRVSVRAVPGEMGAPSRVLTLGEKAV